MSTRAFVLGLALACTVQSSACAQSRDVAGRRAAVRAAADAGRYAEAESQAASAVSGENGVQFQNVYGEVLYARGKRDAARAAFQAALAGHARDSLTAEANLAVLLYESGDRAGALRHFGRFPAIYNSSAGQLDAEELIAVGTACRYLGQDDPQMFKDALRAFDEAAVRDPANPLSRVRAGELLLEKYNSTDAHAAFAEALKVDPRNASALLGEARAQEFDGGNGSADAVKRALEANPNLVAAHVMLARIDLAAEDYASAAAHAARALETNPASLEALTMLAAVRHLEGRAAAADSLRARVFALNPRHADYYNTLAEAGVQQRRYTEAVELARQAVRLDSQSWRGWGILGTNLMRTGAIDEARASLETSFRGDPYNVWNKNTLDLLDTFSRYRIVSSRRFEFMLSGEEADALGPYFAEVADQAYTRLSQRYGYTPEKAVRIEVYPSHADFSVRTLGLPGLGALGVTFGKLISMDSPSARERGEFNWGSTLWHELAHVIQLGVGKQRLPRWFAEGMAVFEERRARPGWGADATPGFLAAYASKRLHPVSKLNNGFVRPSYPEQIGYSYYQASLVCELIERDYGFPTLIAMMKAFGEGKTTEQVFREVLKTEVTAFDARFDAYMRERFPGGAEALAAEMTQTRARFDDAVRRGDSRTALTELRKLTLHNESDYDGLLKQAELEEALGDHAAAAQSLESALYVYPFDPGVHVRLAALYDRLADPTRAVRERAAVVALKPTDRADALYQLAAAYARAGDAQKARSTVMQALEVAPTFERAQELLLDLNEGKLPK